MTTLDSVVAVVAAFNPDAGLIDRVRTSLAQVDAVVVVDDGSTSGSSLWGGLERLGAVVVHQGGNSGIAAALNSGVRTARGRFHPAFILTLDQDSTPAPNYVAAAVAACRAAEAVGAPVGLVAPGYYGDHPAPRRAGAAGYIRAFDPMQSGMLIPVRTLNRVGGFDESLFIDGVDSEFTARVGAAGLVAVLAPECRLEHALGRREPAELFGRTLTLGGRAISYNYHSPARVYYITRNGAALARRYLSSDPGWVIRRGLEELKAHGMRVLLGRDRSTTLRAMGAGLWDAVRGRTGRIPPSTQERLSPPS